MTRDGVISIWFGRTEPDDSAIDAFYESRGISAEILGSGKDENCFNTQGRDIEDIIGLMPFSSSLADDVIAAARHKGIDAPRWISILYDYAHDPATLGPDVADEPIFIGVFDYSARE